MPVINDSAVEPRLSAFLRGLTHHACRSQSWPRGPSTTSLTRLAQPALRRFFFFPPLQNGWVSANHVGTYQRWYIGMVTTFVIPNGWINFNFWIQLEICSFQQANLSPAARYALHCAANVGLMVEGRVLDKRLSIGIRKNIFGRHVHDIEYMWIFTSWCLEGSDERRWWYRSEIPKHHFARELL